MKKIPLGSNRYTTVDDNDYDWLNQYMWYLDAGGYVVNAVFRSYLCNAPVSPCSFMHRLILGLEYGDKRQGDHRNHNTSDNRRENLRICTHQQNQMNQKLRPNTTSQYKGVSWKKKKKKWEAKITINGKQKYLGYFTKEKHAGHAYNLAAKKYFKEFACLNKI